MLVGVSCAAWGEAGRSINRCMNINMSLTSRVLPQTKYQDSFHRTAPHRTANVDDVIVFPFRRYFLQGARQENRYREVGDKGHRDVQRGLEGRGVPRAGRPLRRQGERLRRRGAGRAAYAAEREKEE